MNRERGDKSHLGIDAENCDHLSVHPSGHRRSGVGVGGAIQSRLRVSSSNANNAAKKDACKPDRKGKGRPVDALKVSFGSCHVSKLLTACSHSWSDRRIIIGVDCWGMEQLSLNPWIHLLQ